MDNTSTSKETFETVMESAYNMGIDHSITMIKKVLGFMPLEQLTPLIDILKGLKHKEEPAPVDDLPEIFTQP